MCPFSLSGHEKFAGKEIHNNGRSVEHGKTIDVLTIFCNLFYFGFSAIQYYFTHFKQIQSLIVANMQQPIIKKKFDQQTPSINRLILKILR